MAFVLLSEDSVRHKTMLSKSKLIKNQGPERKS